MKEEFNLSEKIFTLSNLSEAGKLYIDYEDNAGNFLSPKDVKEFIRLLKDLAKKDKFVDISCGEYEFDIGRFNQWINKLAGEKL